MKTICRATDEPGFKLQVSSMMEPCSWIKKHVPVLNAHRDERVCYPIQLCGRTDVKYTNMSNYPTE